MDKLICLGKNYLEHAKELGDAIPEKPVIFFKPPSALQQITANGKKISIPFPNGKGSLHHELEVVIRVKNGGCYQTTSEALADIEAVTLGLDMTLRDLQAELKRNGYPWEISKAFPNSALIGAWIPYANNTALLAKDFTLSIDGKLKQTGNLNQMRLSFGDALVYISEYFDLCAGDLIFTGTPAGVGPVIAGQTAELAWDREIHFQVQWS